MMATESSDLSTPEKHHAWVIQQAMNCNDEEESQTWLLLSQLMKSNVTYDVKATTYSMHLSRQNILDAATDLKGILASNQLTDENMRHLITKILTLIIDDTYSQICSPHAVYKALDAGTQFQLLKTVLDDNVQIVDLKRKLRTYILLARDHPTQMQTLTKDAFNAAKKILVGDQENIYEYITMIANEFGTALSKTLCKEKNTKIDLDDLQFLSNVTQIYALLAHNNESTSHTIKIQNSMLDPNGPLAMLSHCQKMIFKHLQVMSPTDLTSLTGLVMAINAAQTVASENPKNIITVTALPLIALTLHYRSLASQISIKDTADVSLVLYDELVGFEGSNGNDSAAPVPMKKRKFDSTTGLEERAPFALHQLLGKTQRLKSTTLSAAAINKQFQEVLAAGTRLLDVIERHGDVDDVVKCLQQVAPRDDVVCAITGFVNECFTYASRHSELVTRNTVDHDDAFNDASRQTCIIRCVRLAHAYAHMKRTQQAILYWTRVLRLMIDSDVNLIKKAGIEVPQVSPLTAHYSLMSANDILQYCVRFFTQLLNRKPIKNEQLMIAARIILSQLQPRSMRQSLIDDVDDRKQINCSFLIPFVKDDADWLAMISQWAANGYSVGGEELTGDRTGTRNISSRVKRATEEIENRVRDAIVSMDASNTSLNVALFMIEYGQKMNESKD